MNKLNNLKPAQLKILKVRKVIYNKLVIDYTKTLNIDNNKNNKIKFKNKINP